MRGASRSCLCGLAPPPGSVGAGSCGLAFGHQRGLCVRGRRFPTALASTRTSAHRLCGCCFRRCCWWRLDLQYVSEASPSCGHPRSRRSRSAKRTTLSTRCGCTRVDDLLPSARAWCTRGHAFRRAAHAGSVEIVPLWLGAPARQCWRRQLRARLRTPAWPVRLGATFSIGTGIHTLVCSPFVLLLFSPLLSVAVGSAGSK